MDFAPPCITSVNMRTTDESSAPITSRILEILPSFWLCTLICSWMDESFKENSFWWYCDDSLFVWRIKKYFDMMGKYRWKLVEELHFIFSYHENILGMLILLLDIRFWTLIHNDERSLYDLLHLVFLHSVDILECSTNSAKIQKEWGWCSIYLENNNMILLCRRCLDFSFYWWCWVMKVVCKHKKASSSRFSKPWRHLAVVLPKFQLTMKYVTKLRERTWKRFFISHFFLHRENILHQMLSVGRFHGWFYLYFAG